MVDFTLSRSLSKDKHRDSSPLPDNTMYAASVLLCFQAGAQILNLLAYVPDIYEELVQLQMQKTGHPRVETSLGVDTLFGLIPLLARSPIPGIIAAAMR